MNNNRQIKMKIIISLLLVILVVFAVSPRPAQAFLGIGDISITVGDIPRMITDAINKGLKVAADVTFRNQMNQFMRNLAYNAAVKLASSGEGQKPLFEVFSGKKIWETVRDQAIGEFSAQLLKETSKPGTCEFSDNACTSDSQCPFTAKYTDGSGWADIPDEEAYQDLLAEELIDPKTRRREKCDASIVASLGGIDICSIRSPLAEIRIKTTVLNILRPPTPSCTYNDLKKNFETFKNIGAGDLVKVSDYFNTRSNDIGIVLNLSNRAREISVNEQAGKVLDKLMNGPFKPVQSLVDKITSTPAPVVEEATKEATIRIPTRSMLKQTGSAVADAFGVFVNTFASKMLEKIFDRDKGLAPRTPPSGFFGGLSGIAAAKLKFADLLQMTDIKTQARDSGSLLQKLVSGCDISTQGLGTISEDALREVNNCVIDETFRLAIEQKLTVGEAINIKGDKTKNAIMNGDRIFGFYHDGTGGDKLVGTHCNDCVLDLIPLRSILILRKYRIVPVGWELAALYIKEVLQNDPQITKRSYTLREIAKDYTNPNSPFYRLIDPDWQFKAFPSKEIRGPSERIIAEYPKTNTRQRGDESVDEKTCIYENPDGSCAPKGYGYCVEEKPIWRIVGAECQEQNNTCQTFIRGSDKAQVTYLAKTVDQDDCRAESAGCRRYATTTDPATFDWIINDEHPGMFIDRGAPSCPSSANGCSEFLRLTNISGNLLQAYNLDPDINSIQEIINEVQELVDGDGNLIGEIDDYKDYALIEKINLNGNRLDCTAYDDPNNDGFLDDNVACRLYTAKSFVSPDIPGVIKFTTSTDAGMIYNDECPAECVGYQPYMETAFPPLYPVPVPPAPVFKNFIASTAKQCPANAEGCTEFTNLNEVARGGEGLEYYTRLRECRTEDEFDPSQARQNTYFTWEGSEETGFQLRSWKLVRAADGGPDQSGGIDTDLCNPTIYTLPPDDPAANPDCREYINSDLNKYYRLHSRVIFISEECQPLRRTEDSVVWMGLPLLSQSCRAQDTGCRRYQGTNAGNTRNVLTDTFENGTTDGWSGLNAAISNVSVNIGGHSLENNGINSGIYKNVDGLVSRDKSYVLSFWAKGNGSIGARFQGDPEETIDNLDFGSIQISNEWNFYKLGSVSFNRDIYPDEQLFISTSDENPIYIDNIILTESNDLYLINKSWTTPNICQGLDEFGNQIYELQLYCEEYRDDQKNKRYIKSFTRLCQEEFVGCEALVDTHNTDYSNELRFNEDNDDPLIPRTLLDNVTVPSDNIAYLVNDQRFWCSEAEVGCSELGLITIDRNSNTSTSTRYLILDPDHENYNFEQALCKVDQELCEAYDPVGISGGFPKHFKDPLDRVCEFKENVQVQGFNQSISGWFKTNSTPYTIEDICQSDDLINTLLPNVELCNIQYLPAGCESDPLVDCTGFEFIEPAADYNLLTYPPGCYVYSCAQAESSCSEFQDPITPEGCDKLLKPGQTGPNGPVCDYYYFLKDTLDPGIAECRSEINPGEGCVGFYETAQGEDSKYLRADCQPGCRLSFQCYDPTANKYNPDPLASCNTDSDCSAPYTLCRGMPVKEFPDCSPDPQVLDPNSKPGCRR